MTLTTAQAFTQFLADITATAYQKSSIIDGRKKTVDTRLTEKFPATSDMPWCVWLIAGLPGSTRSALTARDALFSRTSPLFLP